MKVIDRYQLEEVVGAGSYGKVFRSTTSDTGETFAIKCIPAEKFKKIRKLDEFTENEIKVLESIQHPNIVRYVEKLLTKNNTYMVYEFCNGGTLESRIYAQGHLSEAQSLKYFSEILSALCLLNSYKVLHRDIKPQNIMLNNDDIKVGDFGFCKPMKDHGFSQTMVGSPIYMAPEILRSQSYDDKADVWSLGVCLYEMLFGKCPYEERTIPALIMLFDTRPLAIPRDINNISKETETLIRMLLVIDPRKRANFHQAQEHLSSYYEYSLQLKKKYNEGIPAFCNLVQRPTKNIVNDIEPLESKTFNNAQRQYTKALSFNDNQAPKPMSQPQSQNSSEREIAPVVQYNTYNNATAHSDPVTRTNTRDLDFYKNIPPTVFIKSNRQQVQTPKVEGRQEHIKFDNNTDNRPISPLKFNAVRALNLEKKENPIKDDNISLKSYNSNLDRDRSPGPNIPAPNTPNVINYKIADDNTSKNMIQEKAAQEKRAPIVLPNFLQKFCQVNKSYFGNELIKLAIKTMEDNRNIASNEVQQIFAKRTKYLILVYNIKQLWTFDVENEEETKLMAILLILKKVHYLSLDIKISLTSLNNASLEKYLVDTDNFKRTLNLEIEEFNKLYEDLIFSLKHYVDAEKPEYKILATEVNKYDFDQHVFKAYLLKFTDVVKRQTNCDRLFLERYLCNILDSILIDDVLEYFGTIAGALESHRYVEIMQKLNFDELKLLNDEKRSIVG